jgi:hypothetical protein
MIRLLLVCLLILKIIRHPAYLLFKEFVILSSYYFEFTFANRLIHFNKNGKI